MSSGVEIISGASGPNEMTWDRAVCNFETVKDCSSCAGKQIHT